MRTPLTPSQTVGPFFSIGLDRLNNANLAGPHVPGERITISGRVLDGDDQPVPDALLEVWQADASGNLHHPENPEPHSLNEDFSGFGRIPTDSNGEFRFTTIKPGQVPGPEGTLQATHLSITLFMRGLLKHLTTRLYFSADPANDSDFILTLVPPSRRHTLIAYPSSENPSNLLWDIHLQGPNETVFFDV
jgi:protocatechuate 3,4-dioxygenase, alpha subunit